MNITFSTPKNSHQIYLNSLEKHQLCSLLETNGRIAFTRSVELGDADNMELIVDGDRFSDVVYVSVNGAGMMVDGDRTDIEKRIKAGALSGMDVIFDATDVNFEV